MKITRIGLLVILPLAAQYAAAQDILSTYAGGGPNNIPAVQANLQYPVNTAVDSSGNFYVVVGSTDAASRVFKVNSTGTITVVAGNGYSGDLGDGGPATQAELGQAGSIAVDSSGNIYITDVTNCVVRKVTASTGKISTIAGDKTCGYNGDGIAATSAELNYPYGIAVDKSENVYIADTDNARIRKITASTGIISTVAGNGTTGYAGDGGAATSAELDRPYGVAVDGAGNIYIADTTNVRIRKVTASTGKISTIAGNGHVGYTGDGGRAIAAEMEYVYGIALDSSGNLFLADTENCVVREVNTSGVIETVAGTHTTCAFAGDGGPATSAELDDPYGVAVNTVNGVDQIYIADYGNLRVRKAALGGNISTVAGNGDLYYAAGTPANGVFLNAPDGVTTDASGNVYIADLGNAIIRKVVASTGDISTIAGVPLTGGHNGNGGPATSADLSNPRKAIVDSSGNVYIADEANCAIRKVTASTGDISTIAGKLAACGYSGDGGPATSAELNQPYGMAFDSAGNLYIADTQNEVIRKVTAATGIISTIAGMFQTPGYAGDGGAATSAELNHPRDVVADAHGNLYIADYANYRIRVVNSSGLIKTFAGNGRANFTGDRGPATAASLNFPDRVALDVAGDLLISDMKNDRIRWVDAQGTIFTVAGGGSSIYAGISVPATSAALDWPEGVGVDHAGNIYIGDSLANRVGKVTAIPNINASAYSLTFAAQKTGTSSAAKAITLTGVGPSTISSIHTTGDFTESSSCPASLASGSTCTVSVTFKPTATGTRTGTLVIATNGFFNPTITITLQGTGD